MNSRPDSYSNQPAVARGRKRQGPHLEDSKRKLARTQFPLHLFSPERKQIRNEQDPAEVLPAEVFFSILDFIPLSSKVIATGVNRHWRHLLIHEPRLWRSIGIAFRDGKQAACHVRALVAYAGKQLTRLVLHCPSLTNEQLRSIGTLSLNCWPNLVDLGILNNQCISSNTLLSLIKQTKSTLRNANFTGTRCITDDVISTILSCCPQLCSLNVSECEKLNGSLLVTPGVTSYISKLLINRCTQLKTNLLAISLPQFPQIKQLHLDSNMKLSLSVLQSMPYLGQLQVLELGQIKTSPLQLLSIFSQLRGLKSINISGIPEIYDEALVMLGNTCGAHLETLVARKLPYPTPQGWEFLFQRTIQLKYLDVTYTPSVTADALSCLKSPLLGLSLMGSSEVNELMVRVICVGFMKLQDMNVSATRITDQGILNLVHHLESLQKLNVSMCHNITPAGLQSSRVIGARRKLQVIYTSAEPTLARGRRMNIL
jgi:hypothetical protein